MLLRSTARARGARGTAEALRYLYTSRLRYAQTENKQKNPYHNTLRLPQTAFSLRAHAKDREPLFRAATTSQLYRWQREHRTGREFILHDGPPYANGNLHMGV